MAHQTLQDITHRPPQSGTEAVIDVTPVVPELPNLVSNPSFATDLTGWSTTTPAYYLNTNAVMTRVTTQKWTGQSSVQVVTTSSIAFQGIVHNLGVLPAGTYTHSSYVKGAAGGETVQIYGGHATNAGDEYTNAVLTTGWVRYSVTFVANGSQPCYIGVRTNSAAERTFFVDGVQTVAGGSPTSFHGPGPVSITLGEDTFTWNSAYTHTFDQEYTFQLEVEGLLGASLVEVRWDMGDGTIQYGSVVNHTFKVPAKNLIVSVRALDTTNRTTTGQIVMNLRRPGEDPDPPADFPYDGFESFYV